MESGGGGIRFEDLDLIYMIPFDLGGPVKIEDIVEWLFSSKLVKKGGRLRRYEDRLAMLKLIDLNMTITDPRFSYLRELGCNLYLILHAAGIAVVTVWIHLSADLSTDDVIKIEENLYNASCIIKGPFGEIEERLDNFIDGIIRPLQFVVVFGREYGSFDKVADALTKDHIIASKIEEKLRSSDSHIYRVVCIINHRCQDGCMTAEDVVKGHLKEMAGILTLYGNWRHYRMDTAKEILGENLSRDASYAIFMTTDASLFIGSTVFDERPESIRDAKIEYLKAGATLVAAMEFLQLSRMFLEVYISVYQRKSEEFWRRWERGESVRPSEVMEMRKELMYGLEEYNNISFYAEHPYIGIIEYGKERLGLSNKVNVLISGLQELSDMARTFYEEEALRNQENLSKMQVEFSKIQVVLAFFFGIFGAFQAMEYLEPKLGPLYAAILTSAIFLPCLIYIFYLFIKGRKSSS